MYVGHENLCLGPYFVGLGFVVSIATVKIGLSENFLLHGKHWSLATGNMAVFVCATNALYPFWYSSVSSNAMRIDIPSSLCILCSFKCPSMWIRVAVLGSVSIHQASAAGSMLHTNLLQNAAADPGINYEGRLGVHKSMNLITKGGEGTRVEHYVIKYCN